MVAVFVRLKWALLRNGFRRKGPQRVFAILAIPAGLAAAGFGWLILAGLRLVDVELASSITSAIGVVAVVMWIISPLYLFSTDNTLDPARLVLLPLRQRDLLKGMAAAAWIGVPPLATVIALTGTTIGVGRTPLGMVAAVVGAFITAGLCVFGSRAVGTALAGVLRTRRGRDLGVLLATLILGGSGMAWALVQVVLISNPELITTIGQICRWTPPGMALSAGPDAAAGRWGFLALDLLVPAGVLFLTLLWWSRSLSVALVTPDRAESSRRSSTPSSLFPRWVAGILPRNRTGAVIARELRYAWRSPRRRSSVVLGVVVGMFVGLSTALFGGGVGTGAVFAGCWVAAILALGAANFLGQEGRSFWVHLTVPGDSTPDWLGRILACGIVGIVPSVVVSTIMAGVSGHWNALPGALGVIAVVLAAGAGVNAVVSVLVPYPMPESDSNPFAGNNGGGVGAVVGMMVGMGAIAVLCTPAIALAIVGALWWTPATFLGLLVGAALVWPVVLGCAKVSAAVQRQRGPELLMAVTPGR